MKSLSFVYPVYNEIDNLPRLVPETQRIAEGLFADYEIILVNDGSRDGSGAYMDQLAAEHPQVRVFHHRRNRGLGAAITTGLFHAAKDLVLYMDSDFPVSVEDARGVLAAFTEADDLVIGNRLGRAEGTRREVMSWTYNHLIRWGFGLKVNDVNFAFKLIRRSVLEQMRLRSEGSFIDAEILLESRRLKARLREVGIQYHTRVAGVSTASSNAVVLRLLGELWGYGWRRVRGRVGPARLIINADDFGLCEAVNEGIAEAHDKGPVTSASLMPTGEAFDHAVALARRRPELDLGVHLTLTQTRPLSAPETVPSLVNGDSHFPRHWTAVLSRYLRGQLRSAEVEREFRAQIEAARETGLRLSHLDGHQHLHILPGVAPVVARLAREYGLVAVRYPIQKRGRGAGGLLKRLRRGAELSVLRGMCRLSAGRTRAQDLVVPDDFRGFSEAGAWDTESLAQAVAGIDSGLTEICCHPGADDGIAARFPWGYSWERELAALTSEDVRYAIAEAGVRLTTYRDAAGRE